MRPQVQTPVQSKKEKIMLALGRWRLGGSRFEANLGKKSRRLYVDQ
jgi:hypothetical protein